MIAGFHFLASCQPASMQGSAPVAESAASPSFLENCRRLRNSDAFRQNIHLCAGQQAWAAICMDRDHRLYMVVRSETPAVHQDEIDGKYKQLRIAPEVLRSRMSPGAFILDGGGTDERRIGVFRIPEDAGESFGIELINHLFHLELKSEDLGFQWD